MPMSLVASEYRAPWWLPGGHLQTIVPAELFPKAKVIYRREIWNTPDDDIIAVDWSTPEPIDPKAPIMVHIHGLEGSSNSHYARDGALRRRGRPRRGDSLPRLRRCH